MFKEEDFDNISDLFYIDIADHYNMKEIADDKAELLLSQINRNLEDLLYGMMTKDHTWYKLLKKNNNEILICVFFIKEPGSYFYTKMYKLNQRLNQLGFNMEFNQDLMEKYKRNFIFKIHKQHIKKFNNI